jgi:hypothetical protein
LRFRNPYLVGGVERTPLRPGDGARVLEACQLIVMRDREPPTRLRRRMDAPAAVAEPLEPTAPEELAEAVGQAFRRQPWWLQAPAQQALTLTTVTAVRGKSRPSRSRPTSVQCSGQVAIRHPARGGGRVVVGSVRRGLLSAWAGLSSRWRVG